MSVYKEYFLVLPSEAAQGSLSSLQCIATKHLELPPVFLSLMQYCDVDNKQHIPLLSMSSSRPLPPTPTLHATVLPTIQGLTLAGALHPSLWDLEDMHVTK